jgi:biopolymer transport protein ExbD
MLIFTLPPVTNSVNIDLPSDANQPPPQTVNPVVNKVVLTIQNEILWNGAPITAADLVSELRASRAMPVEPELQFEPEPEASYDLSAQVLNIVKQSGVTKFGFVGNEKYGVFGKAPNAK